MNYTISITKRTNGGYTVVADSNTSYPSEVIYHGTDTGVILFSRGLNLIRFYRPEEWTVNGVTGYTTVQQVADALDAIGVGSDITTTAGAVDVNLKSVTLPAAVSSTGNLATSLYIPSSGGEQIETGMVAIQVTASDISAGSQTAYLELSVDGVNWDNAIENGEDVTTTLADDVPALVVFETKPGLMYRLRVANGATGTIAYKTLN